MKPGGQRTQTLVLKHCCRHCLMSEHIHTQGGPRMHPKAFSACKATNPAVIQTLMLKTHVFVPMPAIQRLPTPLQKHMQRSKLAPALQPAASLPCYSPIWRQVCQVHVAYVIPCQVAKVQPVPMLMRGTDLADHLPLEVDQPLQQLPRLRHLEHRPPGGQLRAPVLCASAKATSRARVQPRGNAKQGSCRVLHCIRAALVAAGCCTALLLP